MSETRRERLRDLVQSRGFASLGELAESLEVSESTIRRDLEQLEAKGWLAAPTAGRFGPASPTRCRSFRRVATITGPPKRRSAWRPRLIEDHDTILLDGGSTTYELARHLVGRPLQVVTNSLPVAHLLSTSESIDLVMIGGCVRGRTAVAIGPMADSMLHSINVGKAFLSVAGITERGYFNSNMMLVESEKAMLAAADQAIVVADSSKFGKVSLSRLCGLQEVNAVVTDPDMESHWKEHLELAGVELVLAQRRDGAATQGVSIHSNEESASP